MIFIWPEQKAYRNTGAMSFYATSRVGWKLTDGEAVTPRPYSWSYTSNKLVKLGLKDVDCLNGYGVPVEVQNRILELARSRAFSRFLSEVHESRAQLGSALVEIGSAVEMVNNRLGQLLTGARALRNGEFKKFLKTFGLRPKRQHRTKRWCKSSEAGGLWLEYWMGWAPTIGDLYSAAVVLTSEVPSWTVRGRATVVDKTTFNWGQWTNAGDAGKGAYEIRACCLYQARVKASNPNLLLLNQLGLLNPAQVAWQVTPFSWLIGWFVNFEQLLESLTWDFGLAVSDDFTSSFVQTKGTEERKFAWSWLTTTNSFETHSGSRVLGINTPTLVFSMPQSLSLTRAATLIALLTQFGASASRRPK